jgi:histidinol dehydrogenase
MAFANLAALARDVIALAEAEGLTAHAEAVRRRG